MGFQEASAHKVLRKGRPQAALLHTTMGHSPKFLCADLQLGSSKSRQLHWDRQPSQFRTDLSWNGCREKSDEKEMAACMTTAFLIVMYLKKPYLGGADLTEEVLNLGTQGPGVIRQIDSHFKNFLGRIAGV